MLGLVDHQSHCWYSFLFAVLLYSRCPPCPDICKSGRRGTYPRALWSRCHCDSLTTGSVHGSCWGALPPDPHYNVARRVRQMCPSHFLWIWRCLCTDATGRHCLSWIAGFLLTLASALLCFTFTVDSFLCVCALCSCVRGLLLDPPTCVFKCFFSKQLDVLMPQLWSSAPV